MKSKKDVIFNEMSIVGLTSDEASKVFGGVLDEDARRYIAVGGGVGTGLTVGGIGILVGTVSTVLVPGAIVAGSLVALGIEPPIIGQFVRGVRNGLRDLQGAPAAAAAAAPEAPLPKGIASTCTIL